MEARIKLEDTFSDILMKMSNGNPGALGVITKMMKSDHVDPDNVFGGFGAVLFLDTLGIYGSHIWVLYSDICGQEMAKTIAVLRAVQMGMFDGKILADACTREDYSGRALVPVAELYDKVKERLPRFDSMQPKQEVNAPGI